MTIIKNTTTGETIELTLMTNNGIDFLWDVMANSGIEQDEDGNFPLDAEETAWWERWAEREQRIIDRVEELGEEGEKVVAGLAQEYNDFEELQDAEEEALGIC